MNTRRFFSEGRLLVGVALPLVAASLSEVALNLADTAFVGRLGANGLASVATATAVYSVVVQVLIASAIGYQILAARSFGVGDREKVGNILLHATAVTIPISVIGMALLWFSSPLVSRIISNPEVIEETVAFLRYRSPSLFFFAIALLLRMTLDSARQTRWGMYSAFSANTSNVLFNYLLIFGVGPFPKLGVAGSALGSTLATFLSLLVIVLAFFQTRPVARPRFSFRIDRFMKLLRLSSPEMFNSLIDYSGNLVFVALVGMLGVNALASGRVSFVVLMVLLVAALNFGIGVMILLGNSLGKGDLEELRTHLKYDRFVVLALLMVPGIAVAVWPEAIVKLFTPSTQVIQEAAGAVVVVGLSVPLMVWTAVYTGALRAFGRTTWVMYSNLSAVWVVQLPVAWLLGVHLGLGLTGAYLGFAAYFFARALLSNYLLARILSKTELATEIKPISQAGE